MILRSLVPLAIAAALTAASARAGTVSIDVRDAAGRPMADAVVMVDTPRKPAGRIAFAWPYVMTQQNVAFTPHVLIVPVGASVPFPNKDKVRHHVYSFSGTKKFDLKLYGRDETRSVTFDKPGVVALGCNIHDAMSGYIVVVDTPYAAVTDARGHVSIPDVPAGGATVRVWSAAIRAPGNTLAQGAAIGANGFATTYTVRTQ